MTCADKGGVRHPLLCAQSASCSHTVMSTRIFSTKCHNAINILKLTCQALLSEFSTGHTLMSQDRELAERFKYDIISSSLLAASISPPTSAHDRSFSSDMPDIPGSSPDTRSDDDAHSPPVHVPLSVVVLSICTLLSILSGFIVLALLFGSSVYYLHMHAHNPGRSIDGIKPVSGSCHTLLSVLTTVN